MLDVLESYGGLLEAGSTPPRVDLAELVAMLQRYADAHHHAKEEDVLFRAMIDAGMSEDDGPVAFMLEQHDEGRRLVDELAETSVGAEPWIEAEVARVVRVARDYVTMLRVHIREEDDMVYPRAQFRVLPSKWDEVNARCAELDAAREEEIAQILQRADALVERYTFR